MNRKHFSRSKNVREIKHHYPEGMFMDLRFKDGQVLKDVNIPLRFLTKGHIFCVDGGLLCGISFKVVENNEGGGFILEEI